MPLPFDAIALVVAVGALAGKPPVSRWLTFSLVLPLVIAMVASFRAIVAPWWLAPAAALVVGVIIFAGVPLGGLVKQFVVAASTFVLGLAFGPSVFASQWPSGSFYLMIALLTVPMAVTLWSSLRAGVWACQTDRLIGGLCAFAGAALLIQGSHA